MTISDPDPTKTYAVIVGIENYSDPDLTLENLSEKAFKFAQWLLDRDVPPCNIKLFLSNQENCPEEVNERIEIKEAEAKQISSCFRRTICLTEADLLYVFWAGHGLIDAKNDLRLLCQDFSYEDPNNINCHSLQLKLEYPSAQDKPISGFKRQIFMIEACQLIFNWHDRPGLKNDLIECGQEFTYMTHSEPKNQYHLYSTLKGQPSMNDGIFSQVMLQQLQDCKLLPDMDKLADEIERELENDGREIYRCTWKGDKSGRLDGSTTPSQIRDEELFKELLKLNFSEEESVFKYKLKRNSTLLIWLQGSKDKGVQVLREKLIAPLINQDSLMPIPSISLGGQEGILSRSEVESKLIGYFPSESQGKKTMDFSTFWQKNVDRTVIITFEIKKIPPVIFDEVIEDVCQSLLSQKLKKGTKLLVFFLDYEKQRNNLSVQPTCQFSPNVFEQDSLNLTEWLETTYNQVFQERCPSYFSALQLDRQAGTIYNDSEQDGQKGNPRLLYQKIYQLFDVTWIGSQMSRRVE